MNAELSPTISRQSPGSTVELKLGGSFTSEQISEVYQTACEIAEANQDVVICCDEVEFLGTGILQSLIALANSLGGRGKNVRFVGVQPKLERWLALAGLA